MEEQKLGNIKLTRLVSMLLLGGALLLNASCANNNLPIWVSSPINDTSAFLYGIGQGESLQSSSNAALKNAITKLGVSISGSYKQRLYFSNNEEQHYISDNVNITVNSAIVSSFEQVKTQTIGDKVYTLIRIDKNVLINDFRQSLVEADASAILHLSNYNNDSSLAWVIKSNSLLKSDLVNRAKRYSSILNVLDPFHDLDDEDSPWVTLGNLTAQSVSACLSIHGENSAALPFAEVLRNHVITQGINTNANCQDKLIVSTESMNSMYYGMFVTRSELSLKINEKPSKIIKLTSQSASSYEQSTRSNILQFTQNLHEDYLWETLGFIELSNH